MVVRAEDIRKTKKHSVCIGHMSYVLIILLRPND